MKFLVTYCGREGPFFRRSSDVFSERQVSEETHLQKGQFGCQFKAIV